MGVKANHHYIPQFYLRGFSDGVGRQAQVFTFDSERKKAFRTLVRNVGSKRHFNRVEVDDKDPNYVEDSMAKIENEISGHLAEVIAAKEFPSDNHFTSIMNLVALVSVRNPRLRGLLEGFHQDIAKRVLYLITEREERWDATTKEMAEAGIPTKAGLSHAEMKEFVRSDRYNILIDQTHLIGVEFEMVPPVIQALANRNWCFVTALRGSQYITCDDPAVLSWIDRNAPGNLSVGHGLKGTMLTFPLSPELLLLGAFEPLPANATHSQAQVEAANTSIANHSTRQIYARDGGFRLHLRDRQSVKGDDLPRYFGA